MAVEDPMGILDVDPKKLELIRQFFKEYSGDATLLSKQLQAVGRELGLIAEKTTEAATAEAEIREMYKVRARALGNINEVLSANKEIRDEELKNEQAALVQAEQAYIKSKEALKVVKEELEVRKKVAKEALNEARETKAILKDKLDRGRIGRAEFEKEKKRNAIAYYERKRTLDSLEERAEKLEDIAALSEAEISVQSAFLETREKINKGIDTSVGLLDGMLEKTGFFSEKWKTGALGGMVDFFEAGGRTSSLLEDLATKAEKVNLKNLSANILFAIRDATIAFMLEFDNLSAAFRKNIGIIDKGFDGIEQRTVNVQRGAIALGISMDEAFASTTALSSEMASFSSMQDDAQDRLIKSTALLQEFGVSATTTAQIFNNFSKGLGYNSRELEKLSTQLMGIATSLKMPPEIIATEFNAASKELMKYGGEMIKVFEGMAEQSKQTGLAISELLGIAQQFDTFEDAGNAVGKLNAILGGPYLNAINMLYGTEEERIKQLRQSIAMSGRQFEALSRFEQQAIATAAGISDMSVAARLFGGSESEFANTAMSMKEMQDRAQAAQAVQEKFTQAMMSFAIALTPVVNTLGDIMDALLVLLDPINSVMDALGMDQEGGMRGVLQGVAVAIYGVLAATKLMNLEFMKTLAPILAGVGAFLLITKVMKSVEPGLKILVGLLIAVAAAFTLARTAAGDFTAPGRFALNTALVGAIAGGSVVALQGLGEANEGKKKGERSDGNATLVAENGEEMVIAENGQTYMVNEPSVVHLGTQDTVLSNAQTKAAMGGGASNDNLLPTLAALQNTLGQLTAAITKANETPVEGQKSEKPVVIKMDAFKVAETTVDYINRYSSLRLT